MDRRLYGPGARLALLVSLCIISAPTTQGNTRVSGAVGNGRDFLLSSVDYLGYQSADSAASCCQECSTQYPAVQIFTYDDTLAQWFETIVLGVCSCMKTKQGAVPTTTESARSSAGMCVIDGGWSEFGPCSETCLGGFETRTCTNPAPKYGGNPCTGVSSQPCNVRVTCTAPGGRGRGRSQRRRRAGRRGRGRRSGGSASAVIDDPKICLDLVACVQCQKFNSGEYMDGVDDVDQDGVAACDKCQFKPVGVVLDEAGWEGLGFANLPVCTFLDDDMCRFSFVYRYHNGGLPKVWVQKNKAC